MEKLSSDKLYERVINRLENNFTKEELLQLLVTKYIEDLDSNELLDLYEILGGNIDNLLITID